MVARLSLECDTMSAYGGLISPKVMLSNYSCNEHFALEVLDKVKRLAFTETNFGLYH